MKKAMARYIFVALVSVLVLCECMGKKKPSVQIEIEVRVSKLLLARPLTVPVDYYFLIVRMRSLNLMNVEKEQSKGALF